MESLQPERAGSPWVDPGEVAYFMLADGHHSESVRDWFPDNVLQIGVNRETGYGGLVWSASQGRAGKDYVSEYIWVTDNPSPPDFDPRVVSDSGVPYFFDPRSVLPLDQILAALEGFCSLETGDRPEASSGSTGT